MRHSGEPRWELDPASSEDYEERTEALEDRPGDRFRQFLAARDPLECGGVSHRFESGG